MKKNGFTLIELLAVVIILGIIMMIAIPGISTIILDSRKSAYIDIANSYVDAVSKAITSRKLQVLDDGSANYIPVDAIKADKGSMSSPFGEWAVINQNVRYVATDTDEVLKCTGVSSNSVTNNTVGYKLYNPGISAFDTKKTYHKLTQGCIQKGKLHDAWVVVRYDLIKDKYVFYWTSRDKTNHSIPLTEITKLTKDSIVSSHTPRVKFISSQRIGRLADGSSDITFQVDQLSAKAGVTGVRVNLIMFNKAIYGGPST